MEKILVIGATGQIDSELVEYLRKNMWILKLNTDGKLQIHGQKVLTIQLLKGSGDGSPIMT
ncbi:MAG: hypothetical protein J7J21_06855 [Methanomicrobia archaeon]|nr:hypothetical protein [Methanomicrobia archaeon]